MENAVDEHSYKHIENKVREIKALLVDWNNAHGCITRQNRFCPCSSSSHMRCSLDYSFDVFINF